MESGSLGGNKDRKKGGGRTFTTSDVADNDDDATMIRPSEQKVSPVPDIIVQNRDPEEDEFIVLACDGIWDVQTNQECVRMVADIFASGERDMGLVCEEVSMYVLWSEHWYLFSMGCSNCIVIVRYSTSVCCREAKTT